MGAVLKIFLPAVFGLFAIVPLRAAPLNTFPGLTTVNIANAASTGTAQYKLAKLNSSGQAIITATSDTNGVLGVVLNGAGTTGVAQISTSGLALCAFDGTATNAHYVGISSTVGGDCTDEGSTQPVNGQAIGYVLAGGSGAGIYTVFMRPSGLGETVSGVATVVNSDGSLTISPTSGNVIASLNVSNPNTWAAVQTFTNSDFCLLGSSTGCTTFTSANAAVTNYTLTFPAVTDTLAALGTAQTFTAVQTFTNSDLCLLGSSTGCTTFTSANAGGSNYTLTFPALTDTLVTLTATQTLTNKTLTSPALGGTPSGAGSIITINSTACQLATSCAISAGTLTSSTPVTGAAGGVLYNNSGFLGISTTLPSGLTADTFTVTTLFSAAGLVTNTDLANAATTVNGQTCTLGSTCLATAAAGTLTGTTLNATVVTSSLTTVGTIGTGTWQGTLVALAYGGTNNNLTPSAGGIVWSDASKLNVLAGTATPAQCLLSGASAAPTWGSCTGAAAVSSVTDSGAGTTTISPTTGAVVVAVNLSNANTWAAVQKFTNSDLCLLGSSTGCTTFTSANAGATNYTVTFPAITGTLPLLGASQTFSGTDTFSGTLNVSGTLQYGGAAVSFGGGFSTSAALAITAGTTGQLAYWSSGTAVGGENIATALTAGAGISITGTTNATIAQSLSNATLQATPANESTTSPSLVMAGFGSSCKITPVYSGRVNFQIMGNIYNNTTGAAAEAIAAYGTGTAPSNGAAISGTTVGNYAVNQTLIANAKVPFSIGGIVTGLSTGTQIWLDAQINAVTGGAAILANMSCSAFEF